MFLCGLLSWSRLLQPCPFAKASKRPTLRFVFASENEETLDQRIYIRKTMEKPSKNKNYGLLGAHLQHHLRSRDSRKLLILQMARLDGEEVAPTPPFCPWWTLVLFTSVPNALLAKLYCHNKKKCTMRLDVTSC